MENNLPILTINPQDEGFLIEHGDKKYAQTDVVNLLTKIADLYGMDTPVISTTEKKKHQEHKSNPAPKKELKKTPDAPKEAQPENLPNNDNSNPAKKETCKVFTDIEAFKDIPIFEPQKNGTNHFGKSSVQYGNDNRLMIGRSGYSGIFVCTTIEEIKRLKELPELTLKLVIQEFEKRTYPNKGVVLRHFLRDLTDLNMLNKGADIEVNMTDRTKEIRKAFNIGGKK